MQSHDTLMCFEVHTNSFLTIVMFACQFDPKKKNCFKATVQTQIKYIYWIYVAILVFYYPGNKKYIIFSLFSMLKKTLRLGR